MITDNYILMCEQAEEIQKAWKPVDWDRFIYKDDREFGIACIDGRYNKKVMKKVNERYIWLPTQEQLQEIMTKQGYFRFTLIELFYHFANSIFKTNSSQKFSMNELWLAFVMHEKYNKVWTGEKWVTINE